MFAFERRARAGAAIARAALLLTCTGCEAALDVPTPPDLSPLVRVYDQPTGDLGFTDVAVTIAAATGDLDLFDRADVSAYVTPLLDSLASRLGANGIVTDDERGPFDVDATMEVTHRCTDGLVRLTAVMRDNRLNRVAWGTAEHCSEDIAFQGDTYSTYFDGSFALYLYEQPSSHFASRFLFVMNGTIRVEGRTFDGAIDFRISAGQLDLRIGVPTGGDVIASLSQSGLILLRTAKTTYTCDATARRCSSDDGQSSLVW